MARYWGQGWVLIVLAAFVSGLSLFPCSNAARLSKVQTSKTGVYLSPKIELAPGNCKDRYFFQIDFPKGHIGIKSFNAELVDEEGKSVPLSETYLHHWLVERYYGRIGSVVPELGRFNYESTENITLVFNAGVCQNGGNREYYGVGSETRRINTYVPDPYAVEVGDPSLIPDGFEERWMLNVHAIDIRGTVDSFGCLQCRCDLYNVTVNEDGLPLADGYKGGMHCCYDGTHCAVKDGYVAPKRNLYLRYTAEWLDWSDSLLPVRIYYFDVTDTLSWNYTTRAVQHDCLNEYTVEPNSNGIFTAITIIDKGGYLVYGIGHQHVGGVSVTLYGEDGRVLCTSIPIYGTGTEAGNEEGYVVGMTSCYPRLGSMKINDGETLIVQSNYLPGQLNTGVMGLFYVMVADSLPNSSLSA